MIGGMDTDGSGICTPAALSMIGAIGSPTPWSIRHGDEPSPTGQRPRSATRAETAGTLGQSVCARCLTVIASLCDSATVSAARAISVTRGVL